MNTVVKDRKSISIADPLALYMKESDSSSFTLDGKPINEIPGLIQWTRGDIDKEMGLRFTISIPEDYEPKGRTVSDILDENAPDEIDGKVKFGAQFADHIEIRVGAVVIPNIEVATPKPCLCSKPKSPTEGVRSASVVDSAPMQAFR